MPAPYYANRLPLIAKVGIRGMPNGEAGQFEIDFRREILGADFQLQSDGVCRLNPELARRVAQQANW